MPSGTFALPQRSRIYGTMTLRLTTQSCSRTLEQNTNFYPVQRLLLTPAAFSANSGIKKYCKRLGETH